MRAQTVACLVALTVILGLGLTLGPVVRGPEKEAAAAREQAREILKATGIKGGLVVHLSCGDGKLTGALRAADGYLVHGLDADPDNINKARRHIRSLGLYGKVCVDRLDGKHLPYVDNLVNLLLADDLGALPMEEVMRVLVPNGTAYINGEAIRKPWPKEIDEWTHYLHDPSNNAVAHDQVVGPPKHLQWVGSPRWARHHDHMASMTALVSSAGRIFYVIDEGATWSMVLPPKWSLVARDAFNGVILWKRSIDKWFSHLHRHKSGPASLPRRLVAVDDRVYAPLGIDAPLSALDAVTGKTVVTYPGTEGTEEIVASEGQLFLVVGNGKRKGIVALQADSGELLWERPAHVASLTLAVDGRRTIFFDWAKVVCLDRKTGDEMWVSAPLVRKANRKGKKGVKLPDWTARTAPRLVLCGGAVVLGHGKTITALSTESGKSLWDAEYPPSGYASPGDLMFIDGLVWCCATTLANIYRRDSGVFTGRDPLTGKIEREFPPDVDAIWLSHHRCHFSKATDRYIVVSRMGLEFVDFRSEHWIPHHWMRGGCIYGIMPCNGLVYTPPHACACYIEAKQSGFCALAPIRRSNRPEAEAASASRLEKGPAFGIVRRPLSPGTRATSEEWPTFRHDALRSGSAPVQVPSELAKSWSVSLGGRLTQPVMAEGKVFVASVDKHTVYALDAKTGKRVWDYMVGGRVDSPPAIYEGKVLFGSADGWVYCLRSLDGELVWRFRAAPDERRIVSFEQMESVWPVHGNVLIQNGVLYCVAGRSMFLDGGLRLVRLDPDTGKKLSETILDDRDPKSDKDLRAYDTYLDMTVALPDILSTDGETIYMKSLPFDLQGARRRIGHVPSDDESPHVFCPTGFLDDNWFHRSYWVFGRSYPGGWNGYFLAGRGNPGGRILSFDDSAVYGFGRKPSYYRWTTTLEYRLFGVDRSSLLPQDFYPKSPEKAREAKKHPDIKIREPKPLECKWERTVPMLVRAMVLTDKTLFVAGPRDVVDEGPARRITSAFSEVQRDLHAQQVEIWDGKEGALLWSVSAVDGEKLAEYELDSLPAFDGMAAAGGRLYISTSDGEVLCLAGE